MIYIVAWAMDSVIEKLIDLNDHPRQAFSNEQRGIIAPITSHLIQPFSSVTVAIDKSAAPESVISESDASDILGKWQC